jgi:ATP-dependent 26S proteasome regulatory subunit
MSNSSPKIFGPTYGRSHVSSPAPATTSSQPSPETDRLRTRINTLEEELRIVRGELDKIRSTGGPIGIIARLDKHKALLAMGSGNYATCDMEGWAVTLGTAVRLAKTAEGVKVAEVIQVPPCGKIATVERISGEFFEYLDGGLPRAARMGSMKLEAQDRVLLDSFGDIGLRKLERLKSKVHSKPTGVTWDDVGGLADVKRELREAIEDPVQHKDLYKQFGHVAPKGILLSGFPGCGKTLVAKACATALAAVHGRKAEGAFIYAKGPEILNKFVGESEAHVRLFFETARRHFQEYGFPAILFLDEADALLGKRGATRWEGMERTIVPQFLAEMDGLDDTGALVLVATNRPDQLDDAFLRDGRIDRRVHVPRPNREEAEDILNVHLRKKPGEALALARLGAELVFSEERLVQKVSGALLGGLVHRSAQIAIRRLKDNERGPRKLTEEDLRAAKSAMMAEAS